MSMQETARRVRFAIERHGMTMEDFDFPENVDAETQETSRVQSQRPQDRNLLVAEPESSMRNEETNASGTEDETPMELYFPSCAKNFTQEEAMMERRGSLQRMSDQIRRFFRNINDPLPFYRTTFGLLTVFPHTIAPFEQYLGLPPAEITFTVFTYQIGIIQTKTWLVNFPLRTTFGDETLTELPAWNLPLFRHFQSLLGREIVPNTKAFGHTDPAQVWFELKTCMVKIALRHIHCLYDFEQYNFVKPALFNLAVNTGVKREVQECERICRNLMSIQDFTCESYRLLRPPTHPPPRFNDIRLRFQTQFKLNNPDSVCDGHKYVTSELAKHHCSEAHATRLLHILFCYAQVTGFKSFGVHFNNEFHYLCTLLEGQNNYDVRATFKLSEAQFDDPNIVNSSGAFFEPEPVEYDEGELALGSANSSTFLASGELESGTRYSQRPFADFDEHIARIQRYVAESRAAVASQREFEEQLQERNKEKEQQDSSQEQITFLIPAYILELPKGKEMCIISEYQWVELPFE